MDHDHLTTGSNEFVDHKQFPEQKVDTADLITLSIEISLLFGEHSTRNLCQAAIICFTLNSIGASNVII